LDKIFTPTIVMRCEKDIGYIRKNISCIHQELLASWLDTALCGCPGRLWSLLLWRYSRPAWTRSCAACSRWPCFGRQLGWM